jgi:hypothetical protein
MAQLLPEPHGTEPLTRTPLIVRDESATLKTFTHSGPGGSR